MPFNESSFFTQLRPKRRNYARLSTSNTSISHSSEGRTNTSWLPLIACCLGTFLLLLYTSIVTVALPEIGVELDATFAQLQWVVNVYTLTLAAFLLGAGAFADGFDAGRLLYWGVCGFLLGTLCAGLATSILWLIVARGIQGLGGAAMFATVPALIGRSYPAPKEKAVAFAIWGSVSGGASAIGTVAGGVVTQLVGWQWLFLGSLPICFAATVLCKKVFVTEQDVSKKLALSRKQTEPINKGIDWWGICFSAVSMFCCVFAVIGANEYGWASARTFGVFGVALITGVLFVWVEKRVETPVLPLELFRSPVFVGLLVTSGSYYCAVFGILPSLAVWLQQEHGVAASTVSALLVVQLVAFIVASRFLSHRVARRSMGWVLGLPMIVIGVGCFSGVLVFVFPHGAAIVPFLLLSGFGAGIISPVLPRMAMDAAPQEFAAAASSASNAVRQLGLAFGVAICGAVTCQGSDYSVGLAFILCGVCSVLCLLCVAWSNGVRSVTG